MTEVGVFVGVVTLVIVAMDVAAGTLGIEAEVAKNKVPLYIYILKICFR